MDFNKLIEDFARIPQVVEQAKSRTARQLEIEDAIVKFNPDYTEASEILAAVVGQLRHRYEGNLSADMEQCFTDLFAQLDEESGIEAGKVGIDEMDLAKWDAMK